MLRNPSSERRNSGVAIAIARTNSPAARGVCVLRISSSSTNCERYLATFAPTRFTAGTNTLLDLSTSRERLFGGGLPCREIAEGGTDAEERPQGTRILQIESERLDRHGCEAQ